MESNVFKKVRSGKSIIRQCHVCGHVNETEYEVKRCYSCRKSFLPSSYQHNGIKLDQKSYDDLYEHCDEIHEEDLIKGIHVIW